MQYPIVFITGTYYLQTNIRYISSCCWIVEIEKVWIRYPQPNKFAFVCFKGYDQKWHCDQTAISVLKIWPLIIYLCLELRKTIVNYITFLPIILNFDCQHQCKKELKFIYKTNYNSSHFKGYFLRNFILKSTYLLMFKFATVFYKILIHFYYASFLIFREKNMEHFY